MKTIREIFRIGYGPSSSHTMGPRKAAELFLERYPKWLGNVNSDIEKQILNKLLLKMEFYSKMDIKSILNQKINP